MFPFANFGADTENFISISSKSEPYTEDLESDCKYVFIFYQSDLIVLTIDRMTDPGRKVTTMALKPPFG